MIIEFEEDYERLCFIKDSVMNEGNQAILDFPCFCCGMKDHLVDKCFYIHHIPNTSKYFIQTKIIPILMFSIKNKRIKGFLNHCINQKREAFKRKQKNLNAYGNYCDYQESIVKLFD